MMQVQPFSVPGMMMDPRLEKRLEEMDRRIEKILELVEKMEQEHESSSK